jgi:hypothetical protein
MSMRTVVVPVRAAAVIALLACSRVDAQCPDGSLGSTCRATVAKTAARPIPIDANRVAVLPFRVTTADTLLGEGFAELLAQEFTGEGGPRSVDMSTTLSAWRHAGGGLRSPMPLDSAMLLSRRLGAGILLQGNIVGLAGRLSITASMVNSATAMPIGQPARAAGPADSVESLLRQVAASLLGVGASERVLRSARLSRNPAALRSYFEGLALWRRGYTAEAAKAFEAGVEVDSLFASAIYQRWLMGQAYAGAGVLAGGWAPRTRARIDLLTARERMVFEANAGKGQPRTRMQVYMDRRRTAEELGDSPEAWFFAGDYVYHDGNAVVGPDSIIPLARQFFSLAVGLDTQPVFLFHLTEIAINTRDTALMRRLLPAYSNSDSEDMWVHRWGIAAGLGDATLLEALRRAGPPRVWSNITFILMGAVMDSPIPIGAFTDVFSQLSASGPRAVLNVLIEAVQIARGRPASAQALRRQNMATSTPFPFLGVTGDRSDSLILNEVGNRPLADTSAEQTRECLRAKVMLERGESPSLDSASVRMPTRCRTVLRAWDAWNRGTLTDSMLARLDTTVTYGRMTTFMGFEHRVLSRVYESKGDTARAVRAIQMYPRDYGSAYTAPTQREAGRLFLMAKDTTRAIEAYEHYLRLRSEAQPPLIAERDSVKAIVARLKVRVVP